MPAVFHDIQGSRARVISAARMAAVAVGAALLSPACDTYNPAAPGQDLNVPTEIRLSAESFSLKPGQTTQITGDVLDASGDTVAAEITWSSSDTTVAHVDKSGVVTANNPGEANITAEAGDLEASLLILVLQHIPAEIQLSVDRDTLDPAEHTQITAVVLSAGGDTIDTELTWSSDSVIVAEVDDDGVVTPRNSGEVSITAATRDVEASISLYIPPPLRFTQVSAGFYTSCALTEDGATYCWGRLVEDTSIPTRVAHDFVFEQITANDRMACGLTSAGDAYCWGRNYYDRMGESVPTMVEDPVRIDHPIPFRYIHLGDHAGVCAIEETGTLLCWGHNDWGQVGRGTRTSWESERLPVAVDARFTDVSLGAFHGCGVAEDGRGYCWGEKAMKIGSEFDSTHEESTVVPPLAIAGDLELTSIETGLTFSCGVTVGYRGYCWGEANKLGTGQTEHQWAPTEIPEHYFSEIAAGHNGACGLTTGGEALCWGVESLPEPLPGGIEFQQLSAGTRSTCGISQLGVVYCWGRTWLGRDDIEASQEPVPIMWPAGIGPD